MSKSNLLIVLLLLVIFSCEKGYITDCRECVKDGIGDVKLKISVGSTYFDPVHRTVTVYEGALEDSLILMRFEPQTGYMEIDAMLYKNYTVTLELVSNGEKYTAIDAACPQVRYDESSCDEPCYYVYNNIVDLRLRYVN